MVFDKNAKFDGKEKKPRIEVEGKLVGISGDSSKMKVFDPVTGKYSWLQLSLVVGKDHTGAAIYKNITAYDVKFAEQVELKKADDLLKAKKHPKVKLQCYETTTDAVDKTTGEPILEMISTERNGKEILVERQKKWHNFRMSEDDVKKSFKILQDNMDEEEQEDKIPEIEMN